MQTGKDSGKTELAYNERLSVQTVEELRDIAEYKSGRLFMSIGIPKAKSGGTHGELDIVAENQFNANVRFSVDNVGEISLTSVRVMQNKTSTSNSSLEKTLSAQFEDFRKQEYLENGFKQMGLNIKDMMDTMSPKNQRRFGSR